MLKVYLDWNCITHCKDSMKYMLDVYQKYSSYVIFPYSLAHIKDLLHSSDERNPYFDEDVKLLARICGKHLLSKNNGVLTPYFANPEECLSKEGPDIQLTQKIVDNLISPEMCHEVKQLIQTSFSKNILHKIQTINKPEDVLPTIEHLSKESGQSIDICAFMKENAPQGVSTTEFLNNSLYIFLDLIGYKSEKRNKTVTNIWNDNEHIGIASRCDVLVSNDSAMRSKAQSIYSLDLHPTIVLSPKDLEKYLEEEISKEYNIDYILSCTSIYGSAREEKDGLHYKIMYTPIMGLFNVCASVASMGYSQYPNVTFFMYCFNHTPYIFYTEIERFLRYFSLLISSKREREWFWINVAEPFLSKNTSLTKDIQYTIYDKDHGVYITLMKDVLQQQPIPMLRIVTI